MLSAIDITIALQFIIMAVVFCILGNFFYFHFKLISRNKTTIEHIDAKRSGYDPLVRSFFLLIITFLQVRHGLLLQLGPGLRQEQKPVALSLFHRGEQTSRRWRSLAKKVEETCTNRTSFNLRS